MGQTPGKFFPPPTPYGQSPDMGIVQNAIAPPMVPQQSFLPLTSGAGTTPQQQSQPTTSANQNQPALQNQLARLGIYGYGNGAQRSVNYYG